jgi:hypothetical protein
MPSKLIDGFNRQRIWKFILLIVVGILIGTMYLSSSHFDGHSAEFAMKNIELNKKNLILSIALKLPLQNIYRFIRSARAVCNYCYIIIFTHNVDDDDYKQLAILYNVRFLSYDKHTPKTMKGLTYLSLRFIIYYHHLLKQQYDNIFICDLRDTLFQRNIFDEMKHHQTRQLYAFLESEQLPIGECKFHNEWLSTCYGQYVLQSIYNQSRSCAGSILGTYKGIYMSFLHFSDSNKLNQPVLPLCHK